MFSVAGQSSALPIPVSAFLGIRGVFASLVRDVLLHLSRSRRVHKSLRVVVVRVLFDRRDAVVVAPLGLPVYLVLRGYRPMSLQVGSCLLAAPLLGALCALCLVS